MSTKIRATVIGTMCALGIGVLAAACGGSPASSVANLGTGNQPVNSNSGTSGTGGSNASTGSTTANGLAFSRCMRSHGISDFPDPDSQGRIALSGGPASDLNPNNPQFESAQRACAYLQPKPSPQQIQQAEQGALAYSRCMRAHGVTNFPDPKFSSDGGIRISIGANSGSGMDPNNPQWQAAQKACAKDLHLPGGATPKQAPAGSGSGGSQVMS